jgi:hypothetical protein
MKRITLMLAGLVMLSLMGLGAIAQEATPNRPGGIVTDVQTIEATVVAVDHKERTVTVRGPAGNEVTLEADETVKNLKEIKKGDVVSVEYMESIAVFVRDAKEGPAAQELTTVRVEPKGHKPGGTVVDTFEISADVVDIDYEKRTVTLKGPQGNTATYDVDESVKRFSEVKKGDQVVVRYTEALALKVEKKKK